MEKIRHSRLNNIRVPQIKKLYDKDHWSFRQIGESFHISTSRVHQLYHGYGDSNQYKQWIKGKKQEKVVPNTKIIIKKHMKLLLPNGAIVEDATIEEAKTLLGVVSHSPKFPSKPTSPAREGFYQRPNTKQKYAYTFVSELIARCDLCGLETDYRGMSGHYKQIHRSIYTQLHTKRRKARKKRTTPTVPEAVNKTGGVLDRILS